MLVCQQPISFFVDSAKKKWKTAAAESCVEPIMDTTQLFQVADRYENKFALSPEERATIYEDLDSAIQLVLLAWASTIPEEKRRLYGNRMERVVEFIQNRRFTLHEYNPYQKEITVRYGAPEAELWLSIWKDKLFSRDREYNYKEIVFPLNY